MGTVPRVLPALALTALLGGALAYLHDPPWIGGVTSGLREWQVDEQGNRYRWTTGRASFYVPSAAAAMTLPLRPLSPIGSRPITVDVSVDDRWLATLELPDAREPNPNVWVFHTLPLPRARTTRRYRRVDVRVLRLLGVYNLGVQLGVVDVR